MKPPINVVFAPGKAKLSVCGVPDGISMIAEHKSQLLELAQSRKMENPTYYIVNEEGPQHDRLFTVKVLIGDTEYGTGQGKNKKSAEQDAAKAAMIKFIQEKK